VGGGGEDAGGAFDLFEGGWSLMLGEGKKQRGVRGRESVRRCQRMALPGCGTIAMFQKRKWTEECPALRSGKKKGFNQKCFHSNGGGGEGSEPIPERNQTLTKRPGC